MAAVFIWGRLRWDSQSALSRRPKLRFGSEKLINSTLFTAGGNNTLELISNWTAEVDFFKFNSEILDNPEMPIFPDCWEFSVTVDRNRRQIWILQVKIHYLK